MPMPLSADGQGLGRLVGGDGDVELGIAGEQLRLGDRLVAQLVERVGGVGDEFAQEHVAVGIDRMHHEMQELGDLGLECEFALGCACASAASDIGYLVTAKTWRRYRCGTSPVKSHCTSRQSATHFGEKDLRQ